MWLVYIPPHRLVTNYPVVDVDIPNSTVSRDFLDGIGMCLNRKFNCLFGARSV